MGKVTISLTITSGLLKGFNIQCLYRAGTQQMVSMGITDSWIIQTQKILTPTMYTYLCWITHTLSHSTFPNSIWYIITISQMRKLKLRDAQTVTGWDSNPHVLPPKSILLNQEKKKVYLHKANWTAIGQSELQVKPPSCPPAIIRAYKEMNTCLR